MSLKPKIIYPARVTQEGWKSSISIITKTWKRMKHVIEIVISLSEFPIKT
jgi:hypothetical protein